MCKINIIHEACKAGAVDGRNFPLENYEMLADAFSRQFDDDDARDAYRMSFLAEVGLRTNPANGLVVRTATA